MNNHGEINLYKYDYFVFDTSFLLFIYLFTFSGSHLDFIYLFFPFIFISWKLIT